MTGSEFEKQVLELMRRKPFLPFVIEMLDGQIHTFDWPGLAVNGGGASFLSELDGALVDIRSNQVREVRLAKEGVAS